MRLLVLLALLTLQAASLHQPASADDKDSQRAAGIHALEAGEYQNALRRLQPLAEEGDVEAEFWLGHMYQNGFGLDKEIGTAIKWFEKSARGGWLPAKTRLGEIYLDGIDVLQDFAKAKKWFEAAATEGDKWAQIKLGELFLNGWGVKKDPVRAYVWFEFATRQGNPQAKRQRDDLLKSMQEDKIAEAQALAETMAPSVFGQAGARSGKPAE